MSRCTAGRPLAQRPYTASLETRIDSLPSLRHAVVAEATEMMRRLSMRIRSRKEWEEVWARGHARWIVRQGVLGFGLPIYLVTLLTLYLLGSFPDPIDWIAALASAALAALGGYVVADLEWHRAESRFG